MRLVELKFWAIFLFFNFLLFLPKYILEFNDTSFFPFHNLFCGTLKDDIGNFYARYNADIFRVSVDLSLLLLIFYFFRKKINTAIYSWIVGIYYVIILLFMVYYVSMTKIYCIEPILYNDSYLLKLGFYDFGGNLLKGIIIFIMSAIIIYLIVRAFKYLLHLLQIVKFSIYTKVIFIITSILFAYVTIRSGTTIKPECEFNETLGLMIDNIHRSNDAYRIHTKLLNTNFNKVLNYEQYQWKKKPNVYIFFFESYGNILNTDTSLQKPYIKCLKSCEAQLYQNNWHIASALSTSPVSGGGSWISYSSFMLGFNVENQGIFLYLLKNPEITNYDQFFRLFRKKGYTNYRLNSIPENEDIKVPWGNLTDFYAVDKWILYKDFHFKGKGYGFGPCPPDQFTLGFAGDYLQNNAKGPYTLFFIDQNSHHPFYSPDSIVSDWRGPNMTEAKNKQKSVFFTKPNIKDYLRSITYDLRTFTYFITNFGKEGDIFMIIGDHQPPMLTKKEDGFETPVHIISKDSSFVNSFQRYGFAQGMVIKNITSFKLKHQGMYSMFMREFLRQYGADSTNLPEYTPDGIFETN